MFQSRSGCSGRKRCRYHWPLASSKVHADPRWSAPSRHSHRRRSSPLSGSRSQRAGSANAALQSFGGWPGPAPGGSYYGLLQASTFRDAWFGLLQYSPSGLPVGIEIYRQYQEGYQATTTALRFATGVERWFLRAGVVRTSEEYRPFVGITFNGF